jgi:hypothetical protein
VKGSKSSFYNTIVSDGSKTNAGGMGCKAVLGPAFFTKVLGRKKCTKGKVSNRCRMETATRAVS